MGPVTGRFPHGPAAVNPLQAPLATRYGRVMARATAATVPGRLGRIPIRDLRPRQRENLWPAKSYVGEVVPFSATVFREGHDLLDVELELTDPAGRVTRHGMHEIARGTDRWLAEVRVDTLGGWRWRVRAASDDWATWLHAARIKVAAGHDVEVVFAMGVELLSRRSGAPFADAARALADPGLSASARLKVATDPRLSTAIEANPLLSLETHSEFQDLRVEPARAAVGSWYEFFPRSEGAKRARNGSWTSGTFRTAAKRLPAIAAMGFDVVYLPPIHPIGVSFRKGPNNSPEAGPHDPGSPWAIGGPLPDGPDGEKRWGGHDAVHPDLGTLEDFRAFVDAAARQGLDVALDLALQCSPDHPWVTEHPEWFTRRPDGSIAYAENPPKKYQDIYPVNFDNDPEGIYAEVLRVVLHWVDHGVRIFRVDNPHTKPPNFWHWLINQVKAVEPDVLFLAEAFTRPKRMRWLAKAGFSQSYTYFTWRTTAEELQEYFTELTQGPMKEYYRGNFFINTPDILPEHLQKGGRAAFRIRLLLAATLAPTYGIYSGYELCENTPLRAGSEEYLDSEKYELRHRDYTAKDSLAAEITALNRLRREHPALQRYDNLSFHTCDNPNILFYLKRAPGPVGDVMVAINCDHSQEQDGWVEVPLEVLGIAADEAYVVEDLVTGARYEWRGSRNYVRLDPAGQPGHLFRLVRNYIDVEVT